MPAGSGLTPPGPRPAAAGLAPGHFAASAVAPGHVAPCPRRVRARDDDGWLLDTTDAYYVWEHPWYPQYAVPAGDLPARTLTHARPTPGDGRLADHVVLPFTAAAAWYEEDEPVHGHPRSPYVRVDAVRSSRTVTVLLPDAVDDAPHLLARSDSPVAVFETNLPPRWYLDPTSVDWSLLTPSATTTRCPYKGETTGYWSAGRLGDVAWSYGSPTASLAAIAGLVAFDDTVVQVVVDP